MCGKEGGVIQSIVELFLQGAAARIMFEPSHVYHNTNYPTWQDTERRVSLYGPAIEVLRHGLDGFDMVRGK